MSNKRLLLLNGSPRKKGTSFSFARTIKKLCEDTGNTAEIVHVIDYFDGKENLDSLVQLVSRSDIVAIIAPLYADALPYSNIWLLEKLAEEYSGELKGKGFFAVGQCGFPDITRCYPILDQCKFFAEHTGMKWLSGLAYGGGPMINGAFMEDIGKKGEKITRAFKLALEAIIRDEKIPSKSQELITVKIPRVLFWPLTAFLNHMVRKNAREYGMDFKRKAYLEEVL